jgi:hypothetical protein
MTFTSLAADAVIAGTLALLDAETGLTREPAEDEIRYVDDSLDDFERPMALPWEEFAAEVEAREEWARFDAFHDDFN